MPDITLWKPEPDVLIHQGLGKACEESGELTKILARCLIQGIDGIDPETAKPNRQALFEEIADIDAAVRWLRELVNDQYEAARADRKLNGFRRWQQMLEMDASRPHQVDDDTYQCPICTVAINDDDICATDVEMGTCHAACLEGSPVVDLETGEPTDGKAGTFRYGDTAPGAGNTEGRANG